MAENFDPAQPNLQVDPTHGQPCGIQYVADDLLRRKDVDAIVTEVCSDWCRFCLIYFKDFSRVFCVLCVQIATLMN